MRKGGAIALGAMMEMMMMDGILEHHVQTLIWLEAIVNTYGRRGTQRRHVDISTPLELLRNRSFRDLVTSESSRFSL